MIKAYTSPDCILLIHSGVKERLKIVLRYIYMLTLHDMRPYVEHGKSTNKHGNLFTNGIPVG